VNSEDTKYLAQLMDTKLEALERFLTSRMDGQDRALSLQAAEYERRLKILNGEADRLRQMQATYVPRELYDRIDAQHSEDIKDLKRCRDIQSGKQIVLTAVVAAVVSVLVALGWRLLV